MLFSTPNPTDRNLDEGLVVQVDSKRALCKVRCLNGRVLDSVLWLSNVGGSSRFGSRSTPIRGDRVVLTFSLGFPLILGTIPRLAPESEGFPTSVLDGSGVDTGSFMPDTNGVLPDPSRPSDLLVGDQVMTGLLGNQVGVLRGGSVLLKASTLSQVFMSKLDFLVRIVAKNWEHYTDTFSSVSRNVANRVYRYAGYGTSFAEAKNEAYRYHQFFGDVSAAEGLGSSNTGTPPDAGAFVFKEKVTAAGGSAAAPLMYRTLALTGDEEVKVISGSSYTRMKATGGELKFTFNEAQVVTINNTTIDLLHSSGARVTLDSAGIRASFSSGQVNLSSSSVNTTFGGHFITVSSGGVALG